MRVNTLSTLFMRSTIIKKRYNKGIDVSISRVINLELMNYGNDLYRPLST